MLHQSVRIFEIFSMLHLGLFITNGIILILLQYNVIDLNVIIRSRMA